MDSIIAVCLNEKSKNPIEIMEKMMSMPFCHMHGPEHHVMVGAALLTAYKNAGGELDHEKALLEMYSRGKAFRVEYVDSGALVEQESVLGFICLLRQSQHRLRRNHGNCLTK